VLDSVPRRRLGELVAAEEREVDLRTGAHPPSVIAAALLTVAPKGFTPPSGTRLWA
jgi:hypothetical protein